MAPIRECTICHPMVPLQLSEPLYRCALLAASAHSLSHAHYWFQVATFEVCRDWSYSLPRFALESLASWCLPWNQESFQKSTAPRAGTASRLQWACTGTFLMLWSRSIDARSLACCGWLRQKYRLSDSAQRSEADLAHWWSEALIALGSLSRCRSH